MKSKERSTRRKPIGSLVAEFQWNEHIHDFPESGHAMFGASQNAWTNYDEDKFIEVFMNNMAKQEGTELHELAAMNIKKKKKIQGKDTFALYVNDAIGYRMEPEKRLYYSDLFCGTADAILFRMNPDKESEYRYFLRIHDLKTGKTPVHMRQLEVYAAFFFLEYDIKPEETEIELRIYQNNDIVVAKPTAKEIKPLMNKIILFDNIAQKLKLELEG